ncbi:hypothetical protein HanRHA438_Chr06g0279631 [Helianthus annuus]|nr:hypothetical protein HanRHA438_Chr06g0279631 [Helianthus annuus]
MRIPGSRSLTLDLNSCKIISGNPCKAQVYRFALLIRFLQLQRFLDPNRMICDLIPSRRFFLENRISLLF